MKQSKRQEAFLALLEPVYPRFSRYALAITRDSEEAKDLISDTVLVALERFDVDDTAQHFGGLLFTVASRLYKRKHYRERFRVAYREADAEARADEAPAPDHAAEIAVVMAALDTLPPRMRETVVLFEVADLSLEEIRTIQGGTLSGVKSRLARGRSQLQKALGIEQTVRLSAVELNQERPKITLNRTGESYAL